jgi:hypothetical protein
VFSRLGVPGPNAIYTPSDLHRDPLEVHIYPNGEEDGASGAAITADLRRDRIAVVLASAVSQDLSWLPCALNPSSNGPA